jgi:hypothetical protein
VQRPRRVSVSSGLGRRCLLGLGVSVLSPTGQRKEGGGLKMRSARSVSSRSARSGTSSETSPFSPAVDIVSGWTSIRTRGSRTERSGVREDRQGAFPAVSEVLLHFAWGVVL